MYNEFAGAKICALKILESLNEIANKSALIIVNDGSVDNTAEELIGLKAAGFNFIYIEHDVNRGYGKALQSGINYAASKGFEYVLFMDSDLTNNPADIKHFVGKMNDGFDVIKASRYSLGGGSVGVPLKRVIISRLGNLVAKYLYGLPVADCTNGFRAVKMNLLQSLSYRENGFSIIMEELYLLQFKTANFENIPVILYARTNELKPSSFIYSFETYWKYIKYPLKSFILRIKAFRVKFFSK